MSIDITYIKTDDLHFDPRNPRLAEFNIDESSKDDQILKLLWETMAIDEIVLSIISSGFFEHEPLMIVEETIKRVKKNVVIEGNRRLAAVKSILNPKVLEALPKYSLLLKVEPEVKSKLHKLPVIKLSSRREAWKFIGFKHINGPAKWGSFAKAQYIAQIHKEFRIALDDIAIQLGDTNKTVQKLYQGLRLIEQAEQNRVFDREDIKGNLSASPKSGPMVTGV